MTALLQSPLLALLAALATTICLVVLHRLHVRPVRHVVASTQFWIAANPSQNRRTLFGRFSRVPTFLLLLAALLLLSIGLSGWAGPSGNRNDAQTIVVVDTGFSMGGRIGGGETHLAQAIQQAKVDLTDLGRARVVLIEASDRATLKTDGPVTAAELSPSLDRLVPSTAPSDPAAAIRLAFNLLRDESGRVLLYTNHPPAMYSLPREWQSRLDVRVVGDAVSNAAILNLAILPDANRPEVGALEARVAAWNSDPASMSLTLLDGDGAVLATQPLKATGSDDAVATFSDIQLNGRVLELRITGSSGIEADDSVKLTLPKRPPLVFRMRGELPMQLSHALNAIGTVTTEVASAAIGPAPVLVTGEQADGSTRSIRIASTSSTRVETGSRVSFAQHELTHGLDLEQGVSGAGSGIDMTDGNLLPLLKAGDTVLAAINTQDGASALVLSDALFSPGASLANRPGFFILLQRACERLAGWTPVPSSLPLSRRAADPLFEQSGGLPAIALTGDREQSATSRPATQLTPLTNGSSSPAVSVPWWTLALVFALVLLLVEGCLYARGRIV